MSKTKWSCERVIRSFHLVSREDMKYRLASVWEILISRSGQLIPVQASTPSLLPSRHISLDDSLLRTQLRRGRPDGVKSS
jgi:hypothetical protein